MHKKFEVNQTKVKGDCQLEKKLVTHNSKSDLPLVLLKNQINYFFEHLKVVYR